MILKPIFQNFLLQHAQNYINIDFNGHQIVWFWIPFSKIFVVQHAQNCLNIDFKGHQIA